MTVTESVAGIYLWPVEQRNGPIRWLLALCCRDWQSAFSSVGVDFHVDALPASTMSKLQGISPREKQRSHSSWQDTIIKFIIHSKYFPVSNWLKPHAEFTITRCCSPNLESLKIITFIVTSSRGFSETIYKPFTIYKSKNDKKARNHNLWWYSTKILPYWISDIKSGAYRELLNQWRQNDVKSAARRRLLNRWPRKPGDKVVLYLVSGKTKSEMAKLL